MQKNLQQPDLVTQEVCVCVCVCVRVRVYEIMQRDVEKFDFECFIVTARKSILVSVLYANSHMFFRHANQWVIHT